MASLYSQSDPGSYLSVQLIWTRDCAESHPTGEVELLYSVRSKVKVTLPVELVLKRNEIVSPLP